MRWSEEVGVAESKPEPRVTSLSELPLRGLRTERAKSVHLAFYSIFAAMTASSVCPSRQILGTRQSARQQELAFDLANRTARDSKESR